MYAPNVHEITQRERDIEREQRERVDHWHDSAIERTCEAIERRNVTPVIVRK